MEKVLILGVAAVQYDAIKLLQGLGYEVHAIAQADDGKGASQADYFTAINFADKEAVKDYIREHNIDVVYSVGSDFAIPIASDVSEDLDMPMFVSSSIAKTCNNKNLMREVLGQDFEGNVPFQVLDNVEEPVNLEYPFIIKPTDSQGQRGVKLVHNEAEYKKQFSVSQSYSRSGKVIVEKYIDGPELSVNAYMKDGKMKICIASDRDTWPQYTGLIRSHIIPAQTISRTAEKKVEKILEAAARKIGIKNGPLYAQIKVEGENPYLIEITPRLDGCHMWKLINYACGVNLLQITFEHLLGREINWEKAFQYESIEPYTLRFICQAPNEKADYQAEQENINDAIESFLYYSQGQNIRPVNGVYEKIAYLINKG
jgi:biotin carboxylase